MLLPTGILVKLLEKMKYNPYKINEVPIVLHTMDSYIWTLNINGKKMLEICDLEFNGKV